MSAHTHQHTAKQNEIDELVLVVHGVGDPMPGETLSLFARSVAEAQHPLTEHQETLWLEDDTDDPRDVKTFGSHVRHLDFCGNKSTLTEVYWGDLSRVHRGLPGVISGMIEILFGLRYIAFIAAQQTGYAARALQWLGLTSAHLLHGPVLAVNFVLGMLMLTVAGTESMWPGSSQVDRWSNFLILAVVLVCLLSSYLGWRMTRNSVCHRFWYWVMITSLFLNGLMLFNQFTHNPFPLWDYGNVMITLLGAQWMLLVVTLLAMTTVWVIAVLNTDNHRPALHVAFIVPALAVGIWGQILPMVWVSGSNSLMKMLPAASASAERGLAARHRPAMLSQPESANNQRDGSRRNPDRARRRMAAAQVRARFSRIFDKAVPLLGVQCLMFIMLGMVLVIQLGRYMRWSEKNAVPNYNEGQRAPRLIVNGAVQVFTAVCAVTGMFLVIYVGVFEWNGRQLADDALCSLLVEANKYAIGVLVPLATLLLLSLAYLRPALDILLDVITHFYFRSATSADRIRGFAEAFDIDDVTFEGGELYFSRRDVIHRRMKRILDFYRDTLVGNPTLTIISHSQGSMIAIEVINDDELSWVKEKFSKVNFITMGSPFHHIYQQYFHHFYPPLDHEQWKNLRDRVSRWLNIFRIDDFVGTEIEFPDALPQARDGTWSNHAVDPYGHMFYWRDRQVLSIIREHDICRSLSGEGHHRHHHHHDAA